MGLFLDLLLGANKSLQQWPTSGHSESSLIGLTVVIYLGEWVNSLHSVNFALPVLLHPPLTKCYRHTVTKLHPICGYIHNYVLHVIPNKLAIKKKLQCFLFLHFWHLHSWWSLWLRGVWTASFLLLSKLQIKRRWLRQWGVFVQSGQEAKEILLQGSNKFGGPVFFIVLKSQKCIVLLCW